MTQKVLESIDEVVKTIYTVGMEGIDKVFADFLGVLMDYLTEMAAAGNTIDLTHTMMELQDAYVNKDYTLLADLLLYHVRVQFLMEFE